MSRTFYEIAVADPSAKRLAVFTYAYDSRLDNGRVVTVPFKKSSRLGIVLATVNKPAFAVKPISGVGNYRLPPTNLQLLNWMLAYYPLQAGETVRLFLPQSLTTRQVADRLPATTVRPDNFSQFRPTSQQQAAVDGIIKQKTGGAMLFGETGTGKTLVYALLARHWLDQGQSVIILAPEITLSQHLYGELSRLFDNVVLVHSMLTNAQRNRLWKQIASSAQPLIVLGPRSALFSPLAKLGGIVIDEAHDASYKQQQAPYYQALRVAAYLAAQNKVPVVYGSATPNVSDYYLAEQRQSPIYRLTDRPVQDHSAKPELHLISTRERQNFSRSPLLANQVIDAVRQAIVGGEQSLLLLNRRGTAQLINCSHCGWQFSCPGCDHSLVYHKDLHKAVCHYCGQQLAMPNTCPDCQHDVQLSHMGTKYLAEVAGRLFGEERVIRVDADAVDRQNIEQLTETLQTGGKQIIVGTQIIAKGLNLPLLKNVVLVDAARQANDYLGEERYYQLIHQVIGRATRGHRSTAIYLQTANANDLVTAQALHQDWFNFYRRELAERKKFHYPPFRHIALAIFRKKTIQGIDSAASKFLSALKQHRIKAQVIGPMPAATERQGNDLVWQCLIKAANRQQLLAAAALAPSDWSIDFEPLHI